jgi:hypothetical protein
MIAAVMVVQLMLKEVVNENEKEGGVQLPVRRITEDGHVNLTAVARLIFRRRNRLQGIPKKILV